MPDTPTVDNPIASGSGSNSGGNGGTPPTSNGACEPGDASESGGSLRSFYSVQGPEDAARLLGNGGEPWPTGSGPGGSERALLGPGLYTWETKGQAEAYLKGMTSRGVPDLRILEHSISESNLSELASADMSIMTDEAANDIIDNSPNHGFQWLRRVTGRYGPENYFSPDVFPFFSNCER